SGELVFYPSAYPQRAQLVKRERDEPIVNSRPSGHSITNMLGDHARALSQLPWLDRHASVLADVRMIPGDNDWQVTDGTHSLPIAGQWWPVLAQSAGAAIDLAGVWDGRSYFPLGYYCRDRYRVAEAAA